MHTNANVDVDMLMLIYVGVDMLTDSQRDMVDGPPHMQPYGGDQRSPNSSYNRGNGMSATMPRMNSGGLNNGGVSLPPQPQQYGEVSEFKAIHFAHSLIWYNKLQGRFDGG